jgi:hypothetical protein
MNRLFDHFFNQVIIPYLEPRVRTGSIKAAKAYLQAVKVARKLVIGGFVIGTLSTFLIVGVLMALFGVLALLPLQPQVVPIVAIVLGALFSLSTGIGFYVFFREKTWLKITKSYDVMEAVTAPWESEVMPPNPMAVLRGEGPHGVLFDEEESSKRHTDISSAVIAGDKSHAVHSDVSAVNIGGSAAIMAPEAPVIIPPAVKTPQQRVDENDFRAHGRNPQPAF